MSLNLKNMFNFDNRAFSVELCSNKEVDMDLLSVIQPVFYSVTWHFKTISSINDITNNTTMALAIKLSSQGKTVLMHLPCRYLSKQNVFDILSIAKQHNIYNIFAMLGESIEGNQCSIDFKHAVDLVKYIKETFGNYFCICVAGYPPSHPEQSNYDLDLKYLKKKVEAGADFIITQVIFDVETFTKFYKNCRDNDINVPIIPGLYPINSYKTVINMAKICHVIIPEKILKKFETIKDDKTALQAHAKQLIHNLLTNQECPVTGIHLFSLNNIELVHNLTKNVSLF